jgi:hypothetical protein
MQNDYTVATTTLQRIHKIEAKVDQPSLAIGNNSSLKDVTNKIHCSPASKSSQVDVCEISPTKRSRIKLVTTRKCSCKLWFTSATSWDLVFIRGSFKELSRHWSRRPLFELSQRTHRRGAQICLPIVRPAWILRLCRGIGWRWRDETSTSNSTSTSHVSQYPMLSIIEQGES